jgi:DNA-directed RNA polymerase subunit K/omega
MSTKRPIKFNKSKPNHKYDDDSDSDQSESGYNSDGPEVGRPHKTGEAGDPDNMVGGDDDSDYGGDMVGGADDVSVDEYEEPVSDDGDDEVAEGEEDEGEDADGDDDYDSEQGSQAAESDADSKYLGSVTGDDNEDDEMEADNDRAYRKLKTHVDRSRIYEEHPELRMHSREEIEALCQIVRDSQGRIVDPFHTTLPFITAYEKADVLGKRTAQIDEDAPLFTEVEAGMIDSSLIALKEFEEKRIPFIIQRPLPNGGMEYWRLQDLEIL